MGHSVYWNSMEFIGKKKIVKVRFKDHVLSVKAFFNLNLEEESVLYDKHQNDKDDLTET